MLKAVVPFAFLYALICTPILALAQVAFAPLPQPVAAYAFEDKDWGVSATSSPKKPPYHGPTPASIPGARVIKTLELKALLDAGKGAVVVDVLDGKTRKSIPGAHWMSGAGAAPLYGAEKGRFMAALEKITGGEKSRPLVFLCVSSECWLSYNAALHAVEGGYSDVIWYRGGTNAWIGASQAVKELASTSW